jgi:hypothetical protein
VIISVKRQPKQGIYRVRLHHLFLSAPAQVIQVLARYIISDCKAASRALGQYIDDNDHWIADRSTPDAGRLPRRIVVRPKGKVYDLNAIFAQLNREYFGSGLDARITWGRKTKAMRARHTVRLGSYVLEENLIRIHPGLDHQWVPLVYLRWVVFHEMLHAHFPPKKMGGRFQFHSQQFQTHEKLFAEHRLAEDWEKANIANLLCI